MKQSEMTKSDRHIGSMRKLFASAALGTAVISWMATAIGLNHYVFHTLWQAFMLSGAIQGPLFALSTRGLDLLYRKGFPAFGKILVLFIWITLLLSSSIFSYISIALTAYSESALRVDAERLLNNYCLAQNYQLLDSCNLALDVYSESIQDYIQYLVTAEGGVGFDKRDITSLESYLSVMENEQTNNQHDDIVELVNTNVIRERLNRFLSGNFNDQDINAVYNLIDGKTADITQKINELQIAGSNHQTNIEKYNQRMSQYKNLKRPEYIDVKNDHDNEKKAKTADHEMEVCLKKIRQALSDSRSYVEIMCLGTESQLHAQSNQLVIAMNEETLNTNTMMEIAQDIYKALIQDNVGAEDMRIQGYGSFREAILGYDQVISAKQDLDMEIEQLLSRSQNQLMEATETESNNIPLSDTTKPEAASPTPSEQWNIYWRTRLGSIESLLKKLPNTIKNDKGEDIAISIRDTKGKSVSKASMINQISEYVRMYLTDLNDFDKYWTLFWGEHPNKTMLKFSFIFAILLDLFSTATGILLYFYSSENLKRK